MVVDGVNNGCSTLVRELAGWERQDGGNEACLDGRMDNWMC